MSSYRLLTNDEVFEEMRKGKAIERITHYQLSRLAFSVRFSKTGKMIINTNQAAQEVLDGHDEEMLQDCRQEVALALWWQIQQGYIFGFRWDGANHVVSCHTHRQDTKLYHEMGYNVDVYRAVSRYFGKHRKNGIEKEVYYEDWFAIHDCEVETDENDNGNNATWETREIRKGDYKRISQYMEVVEEVENNGIWEVTTRHIDTKELIQTNERVQEWLTHVQVKYGVASNMYKIVVGLMLGGTYKQIGNAIGKGEKTIQRKVTELRHEYKKAYSWHGRKARQEFPELVKAKNATLTSGNKGCVIYPEKVAQENVVEYISNVMSEEVFAYIQAKERAKRGENALINAEKHNEYMQWLSKQPTMPVADFLKTKKGKRMLAQVRHDIANKPQPKKIARQKGKADAPKEYDGYNYITVEEALKKGILKQSN